MGNNAKYYLGLGIVCSFVSCFRIRYLQLHNHYCLAIGLFVNPLQLRISIRKRGKRLRGTWKTSLKQTEIPHLGHFNGLLDGSVTPLGYSLYFRLRKILVSIIHFQILPRNPSIIFLKSDNYFKQETKINSPWA